MNLIIDVGNTRTKFSLFNKGEMLISVPVDEFLPEHIRILQNEHPSLNKAIISSVRDYPVELRKELQEKFDTFIEFNASTPIPFENHYRSKETLGYDRLAAVAGANKLYPDSNILVIDAGTAVTFDFINDKNQYLGGNISPGIDLRFKALHSFTGKLPLVKQEESNTLFGDTTESAIRAGVQNGLIYEMDRTIESFNDSYNTLRVIMTGGNTIFFDKKLKSSFFVHLNLVALGLNRILEYNMGDY
ncbi:Pantothenate kinase type III, CoaX-like [hydrothermal vent metagenome]|uniref:Type III pantothenate kinase n=1 Tax=hydrothermal vent metagenome TaxID=652676 RepID=A0A3B0UDJ9_9ZZZZ